MTNLEVAQQTKLDPITDVAARAGLGPDDFEALGRFKGKLTYQGMARLSGSRGGRLVLVTAVTPTTKGEGKTTVTVGLTQGLRKIGESAVSATREPALGPVFGTKGGACGGGYSQVLPMEDINLFFNGDFPAISAAHNLLSAMLDAHVHHGNKLNVDLRVERWPRAVDMNDRSLRQIVTGIGGKPNGPAREGGFVITPASEIMAVLCLSRSLGDLKQRLGDIIVAVNTSDEPVTARDLQADGAMAALLRDAIRPNIVQNAEGGLAFVHGGPFANIAHGCSSILATECGLGTADFLVTEGGFGSDLGGEKFLNIVCPRIGRGPDAIVLVATLRALQHHGQGNLELGTRNLLRHAAHLQQYGPPVVVAINRFEGDEEPRHGVLKSLCKENGIAAISCDPYGSGGRGCEELAEHVSDVSKPPHRFDPIYTADASIEEKLDRISTKVYGGAGVLLSAKARKELDWLSKHGYGNLPVCVAKTQYSLSDDAALLNAPENFTIHVNGLRVSAGAGFVVAECGDILLMPGLGRTPAAQSIGVDEGGKISGLF